jgi:hypothetical protein
MSQKTHCIFIKNNNQLTLIRAIIVVYSENNSKCINKLCGQKQGTGIFRWFIPVVCDYNISIDKVGKSKHNKTLYRYKESKEGQHVSALLLQGPHQD